MKLLWLLLLTSVTAQAQQFRHTPRRDSLADVFPEPMPRKRPNNSFYGHQSGPNQALRATLLRATLLRATLLRATLLRATLDNMVVKQPDTTQTYTILRVFPAGGALPNRWLRGPKRP